MMISFSLILTFINVNLQDSAKRINLSVRAGNASRQHGVAIKVKNVWMVRTRKTAEVEQCRCLRVHRYVKGRSFIRPDPTWRIFLKDFPPYFCQKGFPQSFL